MRPIDELHQQVAAVALRAAARYGFALGGGNALIVHGVIERPTEDVDLFSNDEHGVAAAAGAVQAALTEAGFTAERQDETAGLSDVVLDAYHRRCAVTGTHIPPVLQAAHIRPVEHGGEHRLDNGLLLRSDGQPASAGRLRQRRAVLLQSRPGDRPSRPASRPARNRIPGLAPRHHLQSQLTSHHRVSRGHPVKRKRQQATRSP
jgi:hypothetical protein